MGKRVATHALLPTVISPAVFVLSGKFGTSHDVSRLPGHPESLDIRRERVRCLAVASFLFGTCSSSGDLYGLCESSRLSPLRKASMKRSHFLTKGEGRTSIEEAVYETR